MKQVHTKLQRRRSPGFSLVEVALAVAIAALGILTCLGLLPEGLEMSRQTTQLAINSNILEQIVRDAENASWPVIKPGNGLVPNYPMDTDGGAAGGPTQTFCYDNQGVRVEAGSSDITFVAQVRFNEACALPGSNDNQKFLARLVINVANTQNANFNFEKTPKNFLTFSHLVAKTR